MNGCTRFIMPNFLERSIFAHRRGGHFFKKKSSRACWQFVVTRPVKTTGETRSKRSWSPCCLARLSHKSDSAPLQQSWGKKNNQLIRNVLLCALESGSMNLHQFQPCWSSDSTTNVNPLISEEHRVDYEGQVFTSHLKDFFASDLDKLWPGWILVWIVLVQHIVK